MEQATLTELLNSPSGGILERPILLKRIAELEERNKRMEAAAQKGYSIVDRLRPFCPHLNRVPNKPSILDPACELDWYCQDCEHPILE